MRQVFDRPALVGTPAGGWIVFVRGITMSTFNGIIVTL
jgi:hypothetical protein